MSPPPPSGGVTDSRDADTRSGHDAGSGRIDLWRKFGHDSTNNYCGTNDDGGPDNDCGTNHHHPDNHCGPDNDCGTNHHRPDHYRGTNNHRPDHHNCGSDLHCDGYFCCIEYPRC